MAEGQNEVQRRESPPNNVINFEAARDKRLWRKSRGYKDPPEHIKIISRFLNRYSPEQTPTTVLAPFEEAQTEKTAHATDTSAEHPVLEAKTNVIALEAVRQKLHLVHKEQFDDRRWHEVAKANGWGNNPDDPNDGFYVDRIVECAKKLGLDPRTLTPEERKDLTTHGHYIIDRAKKLGLNPLTLTPEEQRDLRRLGLILTPEERKEHAEAEAKYRVRPLTPEEMKRWFLQYGGQRRNDVPPHTSGEVIDRILAMIGKGIKAITPPRKEKQQPNPIRAED
jgi:hypothetical protein